MNDIILVLVILAVAGAAIAKIVIDKKKGVKCIGCPDGGSGKSGCSCCRQDYRRVMVTGALDV